MATSPFFSASAAKWLPSRERQFVSPAALPVYAMLGSAVLFIAVVVALTDFYLELGIVKGAALALMLLALLGIAARWLSFERLGTALEASALFSAIGILGPICAVIMASTALPLADEFLARSDQLLFFGFRRDVLVEAVRHWDAFMEATSWIYHSLLWQPYLLIALLMAGGQGHHCWRFVSAWGIALGITLLLFPLAPAVGAPPYFFDFLGTFNGARNGELRAVGQGALTGIITFPSFHAAGAVLLGWAFQSIRPIAPAMFVLNGLMFASALIAGHYLIDLVAGAAVACIAIRISRRVA
jgi:hypothetical protein